MKYAYAIALSASAALAQTVVENVAIGFGAGNVSGGSTDLGQTEIFSLYWPPVDSSKQPPKWSWTVNLNVADADDSLIPNARTLNTVYSFDFPDGADSLAQAVADASGQTNQSAFCVTVVNSLFPANVINQWNDDKKTNVLMDGSQEESCQTPLRKRCTGAIMSAFQNAQPDSTGCKGSNVNLADIDECRWVFDGYSGTTYNLLEKPKGYNGSDYPVEVNQPWFHVTSPNYDSDNNTFVEQQEYRMHMIIIDSGSVYTPLCMRVRDDMKSTSIATGAATGAGIVSASINSWLGLAAGFVALAYAL